MKRHLAFYMTFVHVRHSIVKSTMARKLNIFNSNDQIVDFRLQPCSADETCNKTHDVSPRRQHNIAQHTIAQCYSNINQHESKYKITPLVGKLQGSGVGWAVGKQWNIYHLLLQLLHYMAILAAWCGVGPINITRHWRVLDTVIMFSADLATCVMDDRARVGCLISPTYFSMTIFF